MRFLLTTFEGGGHVPPALMLARRLQDEGHEVLFVSDTANRDAAQSMSLPFAPWTTAPDRAQGGSMDDPLQDWRRRWPPAIVRSICTAVITGPALLYARDALGFIERFRPDVVLSSELLFGVMMAAEVRGVPLALLSANVWCFPTRSDLPPFGPGFAPAKGAFAEGRERTARRWIYRLYDVGLPSLNEARAAVGLSPLRHSLEQLQVSRLNLLATSASFDYRSSVPPAPFAYVGPLLQTPEWPEDPRIAGLGRASRPTVLVSFSTAYQNQATIVARCIRALATLPVDGLVTLGPALSASALPAAPDNVTLLAAASHDDLLSRCSALVCHGGHGTLLRALMHGVPVICLPSLRDQPENAARMTWHGAGIRLSARSGVRSIRAALWRVMNEPRYRECAQELATSIRAETDGGHRAVEALTQLPQRSRRVISESPSS